MTEISPETVGLEAKVTNHKPREYSAVSSDGGVILCDSNDGAFLVCRFPEDIERLKQLLDTLVITKTEPES